MRAMYSCSNSLGFFTIFLSTPFTVKDVCCHELFLNPENGMDMPWIFQSRQDTTSIVCVLKLQVNSDLRGIDEGGDTPDLLL